MEDAFPHCLESQQCVCRMRSLDLMWVGLCQCSCEQMRMHMCACLYTCMWKPQINVQLPSSLTSHFMLWDKIRRKGWSSSTLLNHLQCPIQCTGYIRVTTGKLLPGCWGQEPRTSCMCCGCFTNWAVSLDIFFKVVIKYTNKVKETTGVMTIPESQFFFSFHLFALSLSLFSYSPFFQTEPTSFFLTRSHFFPIVYIQSLK